eukprot:3776945-Pyramimonas_sp.AAC.1
MAAMSLDSVIRSGGHLVLVGDPKQLPPQSHLQEGSGSSTVSIFDRLHQALGEDHSAVVQLSLCYHMHPLLLAWPNW